MELFFLTILNWITIRIHSFYLHCTSRGAEEPRAKTPVAARIRGGGIRLSREEVELVMERIGLSCSAQMEEEIGCEEISAVFEEEEPSVEEARVAFAVFDENRDGFIDAGELQRVLGRLELSEGVELEQCEEMIRRARDDDLERMDFDGFVRLMENSLC